MQTYSRYVTIFVVTAMVILMFWPATAASQTSGIVPLVTNDPIAEYLTKGGAFAVILVILFFYRRDWKTAVDFWQNQSQMTTQLVQQATASQTENSAALRENSAILQRLADQIGGERRRP